VLEMGETEGCQHDVADLGGLTVMCWSLRSGPGLLGYVEAVG